MYCKFCGKQIDDDSVFCIHCGESVTAKKEEPRPSISASNAVAAKEVAEDTGETMMWGLLLFIPIILIILGFVIYIITTVALQPKAITPDDYTYSTSQGITSYSVTVTPKHNFDRCDVEFTLYGSNGQKLYSDTISKTDLKEGRSYTYTFDFGVANAISGYEVECEISGWR